MAKRDIVVIGASAGGIMALVEMFKSLPRDFDAYIFVVQHLSPFSPSVLPQILSRSGNLKAVHPKDGEKMKKNTIYVAPPNYHLLVEHDRVLVKKGPKENRFRPSIDALFRSAAYSYGSRVIGVILSGLLDDGTSGLWSIKRLNGVSIIQHPKDAEFPDMPRNVMEYVDVDYAVPMRDMGALLMRLTRETAPEAPELSPEERKRLETEVNIASQDNAFEMGILDKGPLTPLTCPECSGTLVKFTEGKLVRYRCHTGHGFTDSALLAGVTKAVEENLWKTVRGLEEAIIILEQSARTYEADGKDEMATMFYQKAKEIHRQSVEIRKQIFNQERFSEDLRFANATSGSNGKDEEKE
jgi:two-component system, chemotaxis family, protein-glutamate methylesterase/glutaminase